jgi:hypothetical protein
MLILIGSAVSALFCSAGLSQAATPPSVTIASNPTPSYTTAVVSGEIDPQGSEALYWVEYSTDGSYWFGPSETQTLSSSTGPQHVSVELTGLTPGTSYFVRLNASTSEGGSVTSAEPNPSFTTLSVSPPTASIEAPTSITGSGATLSGEVDPGGSDPVFATHWHFVCTPACPGLEGTVSAGPSAEAISAHATLLPATQYEVSLEAENRGGSVLAGPEVFTTATAAPLIEELGFEPLGTEAALLGSLNPGGLDSTYYFEYGTGSVSEHRTSSATVPDSGASARVSTQLYGLTPDTSYQVRMVVENSLGVTSAEQTFRTLGVKSGSESCDNEQIRQEESAVYLPDCRAYEMVSPQDKNGGNLSAGFASTPDGSRLLSISGSSFLGAEGSFLVNTYVSNRGQAGWATTNTSAKLLGGLGLYNYTSISTASRDGAVWIMSTRSWPAEPEWKNIFTINATGESEWITRPTQPNSVLADKYFAGSSADGTRIFFESTQNFGTGETFGQSQIWEWHNGSVSLVSVMPNGSAAEVGATVGNGNNSVISKSTAAILGLREPYAVSASGKRVIFAADGAVSRDLYLREDGVRTIDITLSQKSGSVGEEIGGGSSPVLLGSATDGSRILFSSESELTDDATLGGGIYRYDVTSGTLEFLTPSPNGPAEVLGPAGFSEDGGRIYFVARAQLVSGKGQAGAPNFYYADGSVIRFVATLSEDDRGDWELGSNAPLVKLTPDGSYIAFPSTRSLTGYDQAGRPEIYRWALASQDLTCVSCGPPGSRGSGEAALIASPPGAEQSASYLAPRDFSADGQRVFFQTSAGLVPRDTNGLLDVYVWEAGRAELISGGVSTRNSELVDNSENGNDVFFSTADDLVPRDIDHGAKDIYDARVQGGLVERDGAVECQGGDCQRPAAGTPQFETPTSQSIAGAQPSRPAKHAKKGRSPGRKRAKCVSSKVRRRHKGCHSAKSRHQSQSRSAKSNKKGA